MDQKWIPIVVILVFYQSMTPGAGEDETLGEGQEYDIKCDPSQMGTYVMWFRVLDRSGMEFIGSFQNNGEKKTLPSTFSSTFSFTKMRNKILTLKRFDKARDSGTYSCATFYKGSELSFGKATRLLGAPDKVATKSIATTTGPKLSTKPAQCVCDKLGESRPSLFCDPIILGSLAGGCGLLLLILVITTLYCNKMRTRRCPHHYKRKPQIPPRK